MDILIFGAGFIGKKYYDSIKNYNTDITVVAFVDNNHEIIGTNIDGIQVIHPNKISGFKFDKIMVSTSPKYAVEIFIQLKDMNIPIMKIEHYIYSDVFGYNKRNSDRIKWLRDFSNHVYINNILGNVAECGVYYGRFSRHINKCFPDRTLYLFDTFDGFAAQDLEKELSLGNDSFNNSNFALNKNIFSGVNIEFMMQHMPHPEKCIVKQGIFSETSIGIEDSFCFVNLDMDLYQPMLAALKFFWNKMISGGVVLLHDYYHQKLPGVALAVEDFEKSIKKRICKTPIGDSCSIALIKDAVY